MNKLGVSISHDSILRIRANLAKYAQMKAKDEVPLPGHFNPMRYVTAAFDNFDHNEATNSGSGSTHDTVAVIFQDFDEAFNQRKPHVPEVLQNPSSRSLDSILPSQKIKPYRDLPSVIRIPND